MSLVRAHDLAKSSSVEKLIRDIVAEVQSMSAHLEGVRPAVGERQEPFQKMLGEIAETRGRPLYYNYIGSGLGRGPYVELEDGSVKLDLINGIGIHLFGHSHPKVIEASIRAALSDVVMQGNLQPNTEYLKVTRKLVEVASRRSRLRHAWLATCGTMANENALKIARQKNSPARMLISMSGAFAGRSTMMAEVTDNPAYKQGLPSYNEVLRVPYPKRLSLRGCQVACRAGCSLAAESERALAIVKGHVANHPKNIAAFVFEPVLGEGGYYVACKAFWAPIFDFLKSQGIAIWADEVQTFTRTGELFAFESLGLGDAVDIVTIAKTAQIGATLYTADYNPKPGLIAGTFSGSTVSMAAGLAMIETLQSEGYLGPQGRINAIHEQFMRMFERLNTTTCKGLLRDFGGMGLMVAVTPLDGSKEKVDRLMKALFTNGLLCYNCGHDPYRLRFLVPATIQDKEIEEAGRILEKSILEMA
jgi:acetylornithine/N-succinyldiaminopimelate aminotransferase